MTWPGEPSEQETLELAEALKAEVAAARARFAVAGAPPPPQLRRDGGAVIHDPDRARAWIVPLGAHTHLEVVAPDNTLRYAGDVDTAAVLAHLERSGISASALATFVEEMSSGSSAER